jgi:aspartyl protease family protein
LPLDRVGRATLRIAALALCVLGHGFAFAQSVAFAGSMGSKALLVVEGQPVTRAVGQSAQGLTLLQMSEGQAQVQMAGRSFSLRLGAAPARLAGAAGTAPSSREIVLPAGSGGHFMSAGSINGRAVQFMVDTGATRVALSQGEADRIGLDYRNAQRGFTQTANGSVPVHLVKLSAMRVGDVTVANVPAVVVPASMPYILLGNSFLQRFQMRRDNDVLRLELRP